MYSNKVAVLYVCVRIRQYIFNIHNMLYYVSYLVNNIYIYIVCAKRHVEWILKLAMNPREIRSTIRPFFDISVRHPLLRYCWSGCGSGYFFLLQPKVAGWIRWNPTNIIFHDTIYIYHNNFKYYKLTMQSHNYKLCVC